MNPLFVKWKIVKNPLILTALYRSPSQTKDQFSSFMDKFEDTIVNIDNRSPSHTLFFGDFNAKNSDWYEDGYSAWRNIANITSMYGLKQIIKEPAHILLSSSSFPVLKMPSSNSVF